MTEKSKELSEKDKVTQSAQVTDEVSKEVSKEENKTEEQSESTKAEEEKAEKVQEVASAEVEEQVSEKENPEVETKSESEEAKDEVVEEAKVEESIPATEEVKSEAPEIEEKEEAKPAAENEGAEEEESSKAGENSDDEASEEETDSDRDSEEEESDEDLEEEEEIDLTNLSKAELLTLLRQKVLAEKPSTVDRLIHDIRNAYTALTDIEEKEALIKFKEEGGAEDDFDYKPSDEDKLFDTFYFEFRRKINSARKEAEKQKEKNLQLKNELLDKLRELVDGEETTLSMNAIKAIQEEWKAIGPVPNSQNRSLWANYNALMDRFYDNRSIYFELKELDRQKNLKGKTQLCEKAEALKDEPDLQTAIKALNELHEEYKHIGPVPREQQEPLWQRFKAASDAVYDRRKEYYDSQKEVFLKNQEQKEKLIESLTEFVNFDSDRIKEWNTKTKAILAIQKAWEAIGPVPRESGKEINKNFWNSFKQFFQNKNQFFKKLDEVRANNETKAEGLIAKAEELKDSTDWQKTSNQLIGLQKEWKTLGPTPEKTRDSLYKRFKSACDTFFDNRRNANKANNSEYEANLKLKKEVCKKIIEAAGEDDPNEEALATLVEEFNGIGFVPRKSMKEIQSEFKSAVDTYIEKLDTEGFDRENFLFKLNLNKIQSDPNASRTIGKKEHGIRRQISELENNISLWKTNLEFFAASKTADKLKDQFDVKIQKAEDEIQKLKQKLAILRDL
ncbi:DUF349 domain-containing protein [Algoriphagus sediminis]|uniref:DUF349 domain-containing protein n=1 Tax=Algoriphagus sediminis TaxID=3057113 RepID=A0ABT7YCX8_9BACT|nr:DUF349 domain-containing protein [Algoriphagus sediminis]MDN3204383.1 DUF349 domain-containing protein [Algoriphagus sediminis]